MVECRADMRLDVNHYSQKEEAALQKYGSKACGLTSLRMVLDYYGHTFDINQMSELANQVGAYSEEAGWIHAGLVNIARDVGLKGFRINFSMLSDEDAEKAGPVLAKEGASFEEITKFRHTLQTARDRGNIAAIDELLEEQIPVIASMEKAYANTSATHLVVIVGKENGSIIMNDPWHNGASYSIPVENFNQHWTKRAVVIFR